MTKFDEAVVEILTIVNTVPHVIGCPQCGKVTEVAKDHQTLGCSDEVKSHVLRRCSCGYIFKPDFSDSKVCMCPQCKPEIAFNLGRGEEDELLGL